MNERHPVGQAHDLVFDVVRLLGMQLREHRLDQADVLGDGLGPDLVADDYAADHATPPWWSGPHLRLRAGGRHSRSMTVRTGSGDRCRWRMCCLVGCIVLPHDVGTDPAALGTFRPAALAQARTAPRSAGAPTASSSLALDS